MAGETVITVVGNLTADPELRYTQNGLAVANFTIASTPRTFDRQANEWKDGEALFLRASVWREFAEHVAGSLTKGSRVIAQGRLKQRSYETKEGEKRTSMELEIDEIGPSLRYATAQVTRAQSSGGGRRSGRLRRRCARRRGAVGRFGARGSVRRCGCLEHSGLLQRRDPLLKRLASRSRGTHHQPAGRQPAGRKAKETMAGKSSGDRRKPIRKGKDGKNAAPAKSVRVGVIDYKDVATLRKFISERGKIRARRITGVSVQEQRLIARAVKNAREMALLPYAGSGR